MPASITSLFSWWGGWGNSFKQSWVGPIVGIVYFVVVMTLLPLAEVRQTVNGGAGFRRGPVARFVVGSGSLAAGVVTSALMFAVWFAFVGEIYVSQFLANDWTHWLNHPLVQLPWVGSIFPPR